jgi:hypothetical protein
MSKTEEPKSPTVLSKLHAEFIASGGKAPSKKETLEYIATWRKAQVARKTAEEALAKTMLAESTAAAVIVRKCSGKANVVMPDDKVTYVPMSRGETVFFRRLGGDEPVELGS